MTRESATLTVMALYRAPRTREAFLNFAYLGQPPDELMPEEEAALPPEFQCEGEAEPHRRVDVEDD